MTKEYSIHHVSGQHHTFKIKSLFVAINKELKIYYTHAYAAWEKGSVENANRHIRRLYNT